MINASVRLYTNSTPRAAAAENNMYTFPTAYNFAFTFFYTIILILREQLPAIVRERLKVKRFAASEKTLL